jgi:hypothetical protein
MAIVSSVIDQALQLANRVDAQHRERARLSVDRAVRYYAERVPWPSLIRTETFNATGGRHLVLPQHVRAIITIGNKAQSEYVEPGTQWEKQYPNWQLNAKPTGNAFEWRHSGWVPVLAPPSVAQAIELNTTASDSQSVYVHGLAHDTTASGTVLEYFSTREIVVAQETPVAGNLAFKEILGIEADTLNKNNAIVVRYADGTLAARIEANERHSRYQRVEFLGVPAQGSAIEIRYYSDPAKVVSESQQIDPQVDEEFLVWRVAGDMHWMNQEAQASQAAWGKADSRIKERLHSENAHGDKLIQAIPYAPMIDPDTDTSVDFW